MRINSIINSIPQSRLTDSDKEKDKDREKDKEKLRPILSYYIINNHIYSNNYNSQKNPNLKSLIPKKQEPITTSNIHNLNININTNATTSKKHLSKNNSTLSSYNNPFNNNINNQIIIKPNLNLNYLKSLENSPTLKEKILCNSKENLNLNTGTNTKRYKKKMKLDSNIIIKKIKKNNHMKSTNDIFYKENKYNNDIAFNTEARKKNKKNVLTTLNSSKNSSIEKIKINEKNINNNINNNNNDINYMNNNKLSMNNSSKFIINKNINSNNDINTSLVKRKKKKKHSAKLINDELYHQNYKKNGFDFFLNYIKGINNIKSNNNSSYKSINSTGNISYKKPKIKINISELKNELINHERDKIISKQSSIKINKYNQNKPNKSARALLFKTKNIKKNKILLNKLHLDLNTKRLSKKKIMNNTKTNIKQNFEKNRLDSPYDKIFQKTSGNYFSPNHKILLNLKDKAIKTTHKNNFSKIQSINITNENRHKIENSKILDNFYSSKINKILKDGMKEINKIKNDFAKHFTTNNSPNKNNQENLKNKKKSKLSILKNFDSNNILTKPPKKIMKKVFTDNATFKIKKNIKKNNNELKTQRIKLLTQNNSKLNIKQPSIPKIKTKIISMRQSSSLINGPSLSSTSRSIIHDSSYYLKESNNLSNYIKNYFNENKKYPETNLNFYKYGRLIGQGAFGKVNLGLNVLTGRVVAIKSFNKSNLNTNSENMKKILYETNLMKKLNHPNITKILEMFEDKEYILIIMEYINGGNLFSFLKKHRKISEKTAKLLFKQIILGIKYMHDHNIVHRDIKLENILIDLNNNIKICDFGIGRVLSSPDQPLYDQCGTPMYIAPEILLCSKDKGYKGFPVDIWSSGIALYILLSGALPFSLKSESKSFYSSSQSKLNDNNSIELQYSIINKEPNEIENISDEAKDLISKLLIKNPEERITCEEILEHPWMKGLKDNYDYNKYHLFTKAEMNMLSKTYVDYREDKNENLKESFTISNLFFDEDKDKIDKDKNEQTKSSILAPFNSMNKSNEDDDFFMDENIIDDFTNKNIKLENGILSFKNKVKEFNMLYEMNNNCEVDNGIIINSRSNTLSSKSNISNNSIYINDNMKDNQGYIFDNNIKSDNNNNNNEKTSKKTEKDMEKILKKIENLGYDKKYVKECVKKNILCHASAAFFLMMNYDNIK